MQVGVLGPLRVLIDGTAVPVPAAKQRVVLAALALRARQVVSAGELAEIIWDEALPEDPGAAVRNYVMRLRRVLGPGGARVVSRHRGYLLEASDDEVDALAFAAACRAGGAAVRAGAWPRAAAVLDEAVALWRGGPLCDVPSEVLARDEVPRLERLRVQAAEWRAEAGLRLGGHAELAQERAELVAAHPLRERLWVQLMLALYLSGRQAEALTAYQQASDVLAEELGSEPGTELQDVRRRVLAADPRLRDERRPGAVRGPGVPRGWRGHWRPAIPDDLRCSHSGPARTGLGGLEAAGAERQKAPC
jgi:DNA-binding SARP family transcriptional activator